MCSGRIVKDDLKDLGTKEVGKPIGRSIYHGLMLGAGEGSGRWIVVARDITIGVLAMAVDSFESMAVAILGIANYQ